MLINNNNSLNSIGISIENSRKIVCELNVLLASYSIFSQNVKGFHWNIKGDNFFELHQNFEELYHDLYLKIDDIAERILILDCNPVLNYSEYILVSKILECLPINDSKTAIESILKSLKTIVTYQREIQQLSIKYSDEGTSTLMSDFIKNQEKLIWKYSTFLK